MKEVKVYRKKHKTYFYNAKAVPEGTVHTWSDGSQHKKVGDEWVIVTKGKKEEEKHEIEKNPQGHAWGTESGYIGKIGKTNYKLTYDTGSAKEMTLHSTDIKSKDFTEEQVKNGDVKKYVEKEHAFNEGCKKVIADLESEKFKVHYFGNDNGDISSDFSSPNGNKFVLFNGDIYIRGKEEDIIDIKRNIKNPNEIKEFVDEWKDKDIEKTEKEEEKKKVEKIKTRKDTLKEITGKAEASWNGKIYGTEKYGYRIYIDNKETKITPEQAKKLM